MSDGWARGAGVPLHVEGADHEDVCAACWQLRGSDTSRPSCFIHRHQLAREWLKIPRLRWMGGAEHGDLREVESSSVHEMPRNGDDAVG